jgi:hypothetical protein
MRCSADPPHSAFDIRHSAFPAAFSSPEIGCTCRMGTHTHRSQPLRIQPLAIPPLQPGHATRPSSSPAPSHPRRTGATHRRRPQLTSIPDITPRPATAARPPRPQVSRLANAPVASDPRRRTRPPRSTEHRSRSHPSLSPSPHLPIPASPHPRVPPSPRPRVSPSPLPRVPIRHSVFAIRHSPVRQMLGYARRAELFPEICIILRRT